MPRDEGTDALEKTRVADRLHWKPRQLENALAQRLLVWRSDNHTVRPRDAREYLVRLLQAHEEHWRIPGGVEAHLVQSVALHHEWLEHFLRLIFLALTLFRRLVLFCFVEEPPQLFRCVLLEVVGNVVS